MKKKCEIQHHQQTLSTIDTDHAPPEGICVAGEVFPLLVPLGKIDKVRRENKAQESYVQRCDQLLRKRTNE